MKEKFQEVWKHLMGIWSLWGRRGMSGRFSLGGEKTVGIEFPRITRSSPGRQREMSLLNRRKMRVETSRQRGAWNVERSVRSQCGGVPSAREKRCQMRLKRWPMSVPNGHHGTGMLPLSVLCGWGNRMENREMTWKSFSLKPTCDPSGP